VEGALRRSLSKLKLDYIDLYLVHWMMPKLKTGGETPEIMDTPLHKVWATLEKLVEEGLIKSIGVSNCPTVMLLDLWSYAKIKPVVNQVELHPYLSQKDFVGFCKKMGVQVTGYSPIGASGF
jgi:diketogulonate reductase-like aldo/keto reductase